VHVRRFRLPQGTGAASLVLEYLIAGAALHAAAVRELATGTDIVHLHNPPDMLFGLGALARALSRRVVFDHHDLFPELVVEKLGRGPWVGVARAAERATFAVANVVLSANESHARIARERGHKWRPPFTSCAMDRSRRRSCPNRRAAPEHCSTRGSCTSARCRVRMAWARSPR